MAGFYTVGTVSCTMEGVEPGTRQVAKVIHHNAGGHAPEQEPEQELVCSDLGGRQQRFLGQLLP